MKLAAALPAVAPPPREWPGHPLFGALPEIRKEPLGAFVRMAAAGDAVRLRLLYQPAHFITHPEQVRRVLVDNGANYVKQTLGYRRMRALVGNGLLTSEGDFWRRQRRIAQPAFHKQRIEGFARFMTEAAEAALARWPASGEVDVCHEMMACTLRVVGLSLLSCDPAAEAKAVGDALEVSLEHVAHRMYTPWSLPEILPTPRNLRFRRARATLNRIVGGIIAARRAGGERPGDLLDMLMEARDDAGQGMSDAQLRDEVMTIFLAGHETTAMALTWTLHLLTQHPEAMARAVQEVDALGGRTPGLADFASLAYLERVIMEAMRLYPPVFMLARAALADDELFGHPVRGGDWVLFSPYVTHRRPDLWRDPERFDPDRFLPERSAGRHRYAYFPFAGGQRKCIGDGFALMEARLILAVLLQRVRFEAVSDREVKMDMMITLRPQGGLRLRVDCR